MLFVMCISFVGCSSKTFIDTINDNLSEAKQYLQDISTSEIYTQKISFEYQDDNANLNNNLVQNIDYLDDQMLYLATNFGTKSDSTSSLCKIVKMDKTKITKRQEILLKDMCSGMITNAQSVKKTQDKIANNIAKTSETYLINILELRNLYINNMYNYLCNIYNMLYNITNLDEDTKVKQSTWHNVDSYQNGNQKDDKDQKQNTTVTYPENYNYGPNGYYGHGYSNPFYYGGYGGLGAYGMYGGMFPFGRNPYMPNIDTFGVYKNIDTYKPIEVKQVEENEE